MLLRMRDDLGNEVLLDTRDILYAREVRSSNACRIFFQNEQASTIDVITTIDLLEEALREPDKQQEPSAGPLSRRESDDCPF